VTRVAVRPNRVTCEVTIAPHDWAAGRDPQLDTGVRLALQALEGRTLDAPPTV
jgi:tricorn protease